MGAAIPVAIWGLAICGVLGGMTARYLGHRVHLGWVILLAALVWVLVDWKMSSAEWADLGAMILMVFVLLPASMGWALGSITGLVLRRGAREARPAEPKGRPDPTRGFRAG